MIKRLSAAQHVYKMGFMVKLASLVGLMALAVFVLFVLTSSKAHAINVTNNHKESVTVIFRAAGCAGISNGAIPKLCHRAER
jgi:hypothetical protein